MRADFLLFLYYLSWFFSKNKIFICCVKIHPIFQQPEEDSFFLIPNGNDYASRHIWFQVIIEHLILSPTYRRKPRPLRQDSAETPSSLPAGGSMQIDLRDG